MDLLFIRHGQGEHTLDIPKSLQIKDPALTPKGQKQAKLLRNQFPLTSEDIISPIRRTLQTAYIWSENIDCRKIVSPLVSPRIFPLCPFPNKSTLPCDKIIDLEIIKKDFSTFEIETYATQDLWSNGINVIPENKFIKIAEDFIKNCKLLQKEKIYIVSHDGTINAYRQLISGQNLSRKDFLPETGWFQITC